MAFGRKKDKKLVILAPGREDPNKVFLETMGMTLLICSVLAVMSLELVWLAPREEARAPVDPEVAARSPAEQLALEFVGKELSELTARQWALEEARAVLAHGPRPASEVACEEFIAGTDEVDAEVAEAALEALEARAEHAPRICLVRAWFAGAIADAALAQEVEEYWREDVEGFEEHPGQISLMVNTYRKTRRRPSTPRFHAWLRRCAMDIETPSWVPCMHMIRQLAPMQGADALLLIERHLVSFEGPPPREDLLRATRMMGLVVKHGQPNFWKIEDHPKLINYDYDLRLGAIFNLCRFIQSPDEAVAHAAADALAEASDRSRTASDTYLPRWRETCKIAFGGKRPNLEVVSAPEIAENHVPQLAIWTGRDEDPPQYTLASAVRRGDCRVSPGEPVWYCGSKLWKGEETDIIDALITFYLDTRYFEWVEDWAEN